MRLIESQDQTRQGFRVFLRFDRQVELGIRAFNHEDHEGRHAGVAIRNRVQISTNRTDCRCQIEGNR